MSYCEAYNSEFCGEHPCGGGLYKCNEKQIERIVTLEAKCDTYTKEAEYYSRLYDSACNEEGRNLKLLVEVEKLPEKWRDEGMKDHVISCGANKCADELEAIISPSALKKEVEKK